MKSYPHLKQLSTPFPNNSPQFGHVFIFTAPLRISFHNFTIITEINQVEAGFSDTRQNGYFKLKIDWSLLSAVNGEEGGTASSAPSMISQQAIMSRNIPTGIGQNSDAGRFSMPRQERYQARSPPLPFLFPPRPLRFFRVLPIPRAGFLLSWHPVPP